MTTVERLRPGDLVVSGDRSAVFVGYTAHPLYPSLALVIWHVTGEPGRWSHDALYLHQDVGTVEPGSHSQRMQRLKHALHEGQTQPDLAGPEDGLPPLETAAAPDLELAVRTMGVLSTYGGFLRAALAGIYAERLRAADISAADDSDLEAVPLSRPEDLAVGDPTGPWAQLGAHLVERLAWLQSSASRNRPQELEVRAIIHRMHVLAGVQDSPTCPNCKEGRAEHLPEPLPGS